MQGAGCRHPLPVTWLVGLEAFWVIRILASIALSMSEWNIITLWASKDSVPSLLTMGSILGPCDPSPTSFASASSESLTHRGSVSPLQLENAVLSHQVKVPRRSVRRPELRDRDRAFLAAASRALSRARYAE